MEVFNDYSTSVAKALSEIDPHWRSYWGLIICGTHSPPESVEEQIEMIREAEQSGKPFLGICFGHQLRAVQFARDHLGIEDAVSEEWGEGTPVVIKRDQLKVGLHDGESYWNYYEVSKEVEDKFHNPKNFFTMQYHPEYQSSKEKPHPSLVRFLNYAKMAVQNSA